MEAQETTREQLLTKIETLQMEIEMLKEIDMKTEEDLRKDAERNTILLQLYDKALHLRDKELYDYVLDQVVHLTDSTIGFLHIVSDDQKDVILTTWNNEALKNCTALYDTHYAVELAGNWVDCVRLKRPVIYNEFPNSPNQKGLPERHVAVRRFMSIPVLEEDKVRIIFGVGNKTEPYADRDVVQLQLVANELHKIIKQRSLQRDKDNAEAARQKAYDDLELKVQERTLQLKERTEQLQVKITEQELAETQLKASEERFHTLFENATVGIAINRNGRTLFANQAYATIFGFDSGSELIGTQVINQIAPCDRRTIGNRIKKREKGETVPGSYEAVGLRKDGSTSPFYVQVINMLLPDGPANVAFLTDISERKQAEEQLRLASLYSRSLIETSLDPLVTISFDGRITDVNNATEIVTGYSRDKLIGTDFSDYCSDPQKARQGYQQVFKEGLVRDYFLEIKHRDGHITPVLYNASVYRDESGNIVGIFAAARDITQRKQAEAALIQQIKSQAILLEISRQFTSSVADNIDDIMSVTLQEMGIFNDADRCYVVLFSEDGAKVKATHEWCAEGIPPSIDVLQDVPTELFPWTLKQPQRREAVYISSINVLPLEAQPEKKLLQLKGTQALLLVPIHYENSLVGFLGFDSTTKKIVKTEENITILELVAQIFANALQRKKDIETVRESENYYRTIFENTGAATMVIEEDLTISRVNEECQRLLGYAKEDLIGKKWTEFIPGDLVETMKEYHRLRLANLAAVPLKYQTRVRTREGRYREGLVAVDMIPGTNKSVTTFVDFTDFNRVDRALKAISAVNTTMIHADNEEDLLRSVCQKIVEVGGYSLAWVGYLQTDQQQTVQPAAYAGRDDGYLAKLNITLQDPQRGQGPTASAIRTGQPVVSRDYNKDDTMKPWLKDALRRGFKSSMAIPLLADNKVLGALTIYSSETDRFDSDEEKLLIEMANDLAYAVMFLRNRIEKNHTAQELAKSLEKMKRILLQEVTSLGAALNVKDPFTAGHQKRVARLAAAIAEEMGLSKDQIEGLAVVGNLHDIGKISIPSEILNKPGKLSDLEFALIKTHSQAGYEIVKDIEFSWPVTEIILQTHERMNGSGYPRGLAGEDILMEARIMAVADVVEAMASHRPYRPALGIDAALEEIVQNRGILYDPDVVDTCLKLFQEQGFKLE